MGTYHEPRAPQGAPTDGEHDVWLEDGKVKFGHWVNASSTWVVDREISYNDDEVTGTSQIDPNDSYEAEEWKNVGSSGNAQFVTGWSNPDSSNPLKYRLLTNGHVEVHGKAINDSSANLFITTMLSGYRPASDLVTASTPRMQYLVSGEWIDTFAEISSAYGDFAIGSTISAGTEVKFDCFCYPL